MSVEITAFMPSDLVRPGQGKRVFAIGDVHGQDDAFEHVLNAMAEAAEESKEKTELVLLGDLIDRGPSPTRCLDLAMKPAEELGFDYKTVLMGNHEQMARLALGLPDHFFELWMRNGGHTIYREAGLTVEEMKDLEQQRLVADWFRRTVGWERRLFLRSLKSHRQIGNLLFVHAGIAPGEPREEFLAAPWHGNGVRTAGYIDEYHWAWIRRPFLEHQTGWGGDLIVHGHSIEKHQVQREGLDEDQAHRIRFDRLGLDGGAAIFDAVVGAEFVDGAYRIFRAETANTNPYAPKAPTKPVKRVETEESRKNAEFLRREKEIGDRVRAGGIELPSAIAELREAYFFTQDQLSLLTKMPVDRINDIENGDVDPTLSELNRLLRPFTFVVGAIAKKES